MDDPLNGRDFSRLGERDSSAVVSSGAGTSVGGDEDRVVPPIPEVAEEVWGCDEAEKKEKFCLEGENFPRLPGDDRRGTSGSSFMGGLNLSWGKTGVVFAGKTDDVADKNDAEHPNVDVEAAGDKNGVVVGEEARRPRMAVCSDCRNKEWKLSEVFFPALPRRSVDVPDVGRASAWSWGVGQETVAPESKPATLGHTADAAGSKIRDGWDDEEDTLSPSLTASPALTSVGTATPPDPEMVMHTLGGAAYGDKFLKNAGESSLEQLYEERPPPSLAGREGGRSHEGHGADGAVVALVTDEVPGELGEPLPRKTTRPWRRGGWTEGAPEHSVPRGTPDVAAPRCDIPPRSSVPPWRRKNDAQSKEAPGTGTPPARPVDDHIRNAPWRKPVDDHIRNAPWRQSKPC